MKISSINKAIIIVVTLILTVASVTAAYFNFDDIEIKDVEGEIGRDDGIVIMLPEKNESSEVKPGGFNGNPFLLPGDEGFPVTPGGITEPEPEPEPVPGDTDGDGVQDDFDLDGKTDVILGAVNEVINTGEMPTWEPSGEYMEIDKLMLVNKTNAVTADYVPVDLVRAEYRALNRTESGQYLTREACDAFNKLASDAADIGYEIVVTTAYRSYNFQSYLYNNYVAKDGQAAADRYSARPGTSEHQSGLASDVSSPSVNYELTSNYINTEEGKWLADNCYKYGFIIRFPDGDEDITGYIYEPWHIRYVGQEHARKIYALDITLEEYLEQYVNVAEETPADISEDDSTQDEALAGDEASSED